MIERERKEALDRLCRAVVRERDRWMCAICGRTREVTVLDWAHVYTRGRISLRWNLDNSMLLCKKCHMQWHGVIPWVFDPETNTDIDSVKYMRRAWEKKFPERDRRLTVLIRSRGAKVDLGLIEAHLRQEFRRLTGLQWGGV